MPRVADETRQAARRRRVKAQQRFTVARKAEAAFARKLRAVAKQVGVIVRGYAPRGMVENMPQLNATLLKYSELLLPWARAASEQLVAEIGRRDQKAWINASSDLGLGLKKEIRSAPTGEAMRGLMAEQVELITSLPIEAAQRVHKLTIEGMLNGTRARETAKEILRTGHVTASRAMLIARTETTRTATAMTQARAEYVGSESYIWRTAGDSDVRPLHKKLNGKVFRWDSPPITGEAGERSHPGAIYNCRCYPEPVIPD